MEPDVILEPPYELFFRRPLTDSPQSSISITNRRQVPLAFKVRTTSPRQFSVRPNMGTLEPGETKKIIVLLCPMDEDPPMDFICKAKFQIIANSVTASQDPSVTPDPSDEFSRKLAVVFLPREEPPAEYFNKETKAGTPIPPVTKAETPIHSTTKSEVSTHPIAKVGTLVPPTAKSETFISPTTKAVTPIPHTAKAGTPIPPAQIEPPHSSNGLSMNHFQSNSNELREKTQTPSGPTPTLTPAVEEKVTSKIVDVDPSVQLKEAQQRLKKLDALLIENQRKYERNEETNKRTQERIRILEKELESVVKPSLIPGSQPSENLEMMSGKMGFPPILVALIALLSFLIGWLFKLS